MSVPSIAYVYVGADGTVAAHAIDVRGFCESVAEQTQSSFALAWAQFDKRCLFARYATTSQDLLEIVIQQASQEKSLGSSLGSGLASCSIGNSQGLTPKLQSCVL